MVVVHQLTTHAHAVLILQSNHHVRTYTSMTSYQFWIMHHTATLLSFYTIWLANLLHTQTLS